MPYNTAKKAPSPTGKPSKVKVDLVETLGKGGKRPSAPKKKAAPKRGMTRAEKMDKGLPLSPIKKKK